jgi:hypothetical protein
MLAVVSENNVFSLGAVSACGAVHAFAKMPGRDFVIGVCGDRDDLGTVFSYDKKNGVRLYGRLFFHDMSAPGLLGASNRPSCAAFSPNGKILVIGVEDEMGCVYCFKPVFDLIETK